MGYIDYCFNYFHCKKNLVSCLFTVCLAGCVSPTKQTDQLLSANHSFPRKFEILGVPFVAQTEAHCGPATLTMAMQWAGKKINLEKVSPQVFTPGMKGSLQADMIGASRRNGLMAVPISGMNSLMTEIANNHPVVVFENLAVSWLPQWHYAIVFGYDLDKPHVLMHSGPEENKQWDLRKFERSWMLGDYWGLVILPPGQIAISADELANMTAAAALEQAGFTKEAELSYLKIEQHWPNSLSALIGLGNIAYTNNKFQEAVDFLKKAIKYHPESLVAKKNLVIAENALKAKSPNIRRK